MIQWKVSKAEAGSQLLSFLQEKLGMSWSKRQVKRCLDRHSCTINGCVERFATTPVKLGDEVIFRESVIPPPFKVEEGRILYEDEHLIVYDKPAGIVSDASGTWLALRERRMSLQPVHRLDADTTGAWILAKGAQVCEALTALFRRRKIDKQYLAVVDGIPRRLEGKERSYLARLAVNGQVQWGKVEKKRGVLAITRWCCEFRGKGIALLRCYPETGRTHQIRVHLKDMGHPILGDCQYSRNFRSPLLPRRHLLHACSVEFVHPVDQRRIKVEAPLPEDFLEVLP